jgi:hypothetical protein
VAFFISVVCDGNGTYVLGNGLAFGSDSAPIPGLPVLSRDGVAVPVVLAAVEVDDALADGDGAGVGAGLCAHATPAAQSRRRLVVRIQR